ncbi:hypothetical protein H206_06124 [Candidatus Electrothrix aarhusensis]|uniref:Uncharacterized protein n=1 Tax=Candidatus Electrothrix aarhusensis TaxID=1859131 RepID=A0A3S3SQB1_9BACT|nr:hypothetical protein H206_06124 [Candidatus Electrothrix aarhusensis]
MGGRADALFDPGLKIIAAAQFTGIYPGQLTVQLQGLPELLDNVVILRRMGDENMVGHGMIFSVSWF